VRLPPSYVLLPFALAFACRNGESGGTGRASASSRANAATSARCDAPISPLEGAHGAFIGTRFGPLLVRERLEAGSEVSLSIDDLRRPCDEKSPRLLVVRLDAPWCGTCVASVDRYAAALRPLASDVVALEVVFSGADNGPASAEDATTWRAAHPSLPGRIARAADSAAAELLRFQRAAPAIFVVELRSMKLLDVLANPTAEVVEARLRRALSQVGVQPKTKEVQPAPLADARFSPEDWALLRAMRIPETPPADPSNAHADDPAAAALGKSLFFDPLLGGGPSIACASCHAPKLAFSDGRPTAHGAQDTELNTLGLGPAAYNRWWFWDGRADSLWAQATSPIENPREMNGTRLGVVRRVVKQHRPAYERVFGSLPPQAERFPRAGRPGDATFDGMTPEDRDAATRIFANAAKAIAAYERILRPQHSRLDAYLDGKLDALTERERDGMKAFIDGGCAVCHHGPMLTDGAFHDIRMPGSLPEGPAQRGRIDGVRSLLASAFRKDGPFSDARAAGAGLAGLVPVDAMLGQVKTPSLRDVALTGPFGHGGTFKSLEDVVGHYDIEELTAAGPARTGSLDPAVVSFSPSPEQLDALVKFLRVVGGAK
jgi:cytochrome c peroxidase